jgi:hypothetical protein
MVLPRVIAAGVLAALVSVFWVPAAFAGGTGATSVNPATIGEGGTAQVHADLTATGSGSDLPAVANLRIGDVGEGTLLTLTFVSSSANLTGCAAGAADASNEITCNWNGATDGQAATIDATVTALAGSGQGDSWTYTAQMSVVDADGVQESVRGGPFLTLDVTAPFPTTTTTAPPTSSSTAPPTSSSTALPVTSAPVTTPPPTAAETTVAATDPGAGNVGALPPTGSTYRMPLYVGLGAFAGGSALVIVATRRRASS